ncbi:MAG: YceD family protein [Verrucomicrobiota bacterium]
MPAKVNLRLLERKPAALSGELEPAEFARDWSDPLMEFHVPLTYDLRVQRQGHELFVEGRLSTRADFTCARCLQAFPLEVGNPAFTALIPLEGEESAPRDGDFADLTPFLREDTLLSLPTNPLCRPECRGLARKASARDSRLETPRAPDNPPAPATPWDALDQLNLKT